MRATRVSRVTKTGDASGIFSSCSRRNARGHRARKNTRTPRPRSGRAGKNPRDACKIVQSSFHSFHARAAVDARADGEVCERVLTEDAGVFLDAFFFAIVASLG